jgi:hypothetical protein
MKNYGYYKIFQFWKFIFLIFSSWLSRVVPTATGVPITTVALKFFYPAFGSLLLRYYV